MPTYRPQFLWLLMGPLLGAFSGSVVAFALLLAVVLSDGGPPADASGLAASVLAPLAIGIVYGGVCGAVVGFVVGLPFVFVVGRHLPRAVAQRRARLLGALLPPIAMLAAVRILYGEGVGPGLGLPRGEDWWALAPLVAAAALGAPLASWAARTDLPRPDVS